MTQKTDEDDNNQDEDETGFRLNLPNSSWIRGDGSHLSQVMPALKWILAAVTATHLVLRMIEEWKAT